MGDEGRNDSEIRADLRQIHEAVAALHDEAARRHHLAADFYEQQGDRTRATAERRAAVLDELKAKYEWVTASEQ